METFIAFLENIGFPALTVIVELVFGYLIIKNILKHGMKYISYIFTRGYPQIYKILSAYFQISQGYTFPSFCNLFINLSGLLKEL